MLDLDVSFGNTRRGSRFLNSIKNMYDVEKCGLSKAYMSILGEVNKKSNALFYIYFR